MDGRSGQGGDIEKPPHLGRGLPYCVNHGPSAPLIHREELGAVAGPINTLLENVMDFIPNLVGAGLIFFAANKHWLRRDFTLRG